MDQIKAFIKGLREFRSGFTTHYESDELLEAYDMGRELAHRLTLRRFDY